MNEINETDIQSDIDRKLTIKLLEQVPAIVFLLSAFSLSLSFLFNFGYFYAFGLELLSAFSFKDYLDGSLIFIVLSAPALLYCINRREDDLLKVSKRFIDGFREVSSEIKSASLIKKVFAAPLVFFLMVLIFLLQTIGVSTALFILLSWSYSTYSLLEKNKVDWLSFTSWAQIKCIGIYLIALLLVKSRPEKYRLRKKTLLFIITAATMVFSFGMLQAVEDCFAKANASIIETSGNNIKDIRVLRSIDKGVFYFDKHSLSLKFINWNNIATIDLQLSRTSH